MGNITDRLATFVAELGYDDLPEEVAERAKRLLLDLSGIIIRARYDAESTPSLISAVEKLGLTGGDCSVLGDSRRYVPSAAALINGTLAHSLDFDDTHAEGSIHSSAPIVPAALAASEMTGASGKELLTAVVAGYEVQIRLSMALNPSEHYAQGFHPTATCGVFGAAAAVAKLLGLDADGVRNAFGIALSQAAGSMEFLVDGSWTKRSHVGQAAQNGLICAVLAAEGFVGPKQAFEGRAGLFKAYSPASQPDKATKGLGSTWETLRLAVKPYPSCRYSHAAIDGIVALVNEHDIDPIDIEEMEIGLPETGWKIIGGPDDKTNPKGVVDAQFSMPFCAAVAARAGGLSWDDYDEHLGDEKTRALTRRVKVVIDPRAEAEFPTNMAGVARIRTKNGMFEAFVAEPKGEPGNFLADDEFRRKFGDLAAPYLGQDQTVRLADALLSLEQANTISSVLALGQGRGRVVVAEAREVAKGRFRESYGRYFEEFNEGDIYEHRPGRTISEADNSWFTLLTMNQHPLHFDFEYAAKSEFGKPVVNSCLTLSIVAGMSVSDISQKTIANLGWDKIKLVAPVFIGDTIYAESEVLAKRESKSRPTQGIVTVRTIGKKADGTEFMSYERSMLIPKRGHAVDDAANY